MKFPISVKCYDVLNIPGKKIDVIHTFENEEEYSHWLRLIEQWDNMHSKHNKKKKTSQREILDKAQPPTMIITHYVKGA